MGWAKFDDQFTDHPKVVAAGPMAELLAMRAVIHCARYETDGHVQAAQLPRLSYGITSPAKQVDALVAAGLWEPCDNGWMIHDFLDYHPSKAEQDDKRRQARERMANQRGKKTSGSQDVRANETRTAEELRSTPTRPDPSPKEESSRTRSDRATRLPDEWTPAPEPDLIAAAGGQAAADSQLDRFRDYWAAQPGAKGRKVDWQATWRNWLRRHADQRQPQARDGPAPRRHAVVGSEDWDRQRAEQEALERRLLGESA